MYTTDTKAPIDGLVMIEFVTKSLITDACEEGAGDPLRTVDSKTKAAFTRKYNKERTALPYSIANPVSKKNGSRGCEDLMSGEKDILDDDEDGDNIEKDASIKIKKPKVVGKDDSRSSKGKGKGQGLKQK